MLFIVPFEVEELGDKAVKDYQASFSEGTDKLPYCNLLLLGKEGVGKTSLLKQLIRKPYQKVMERTRGIDNTIDCTVEQKGVDISNDNWQANKGDIGEKFVQALAREFMRRFPGKSLDGAMEFNEADLLKEIETFTFEKTSSSSVSMDSRFSRLSISVNSHQNSGKMNSKCHENKEMSLVLNVLDFAGQEMYRSMHHCFICKRGVYAVVFRLPDMLDYIHKPDDASYNPLSDIFYWVRSIHAHVRTLSDPKKETLIKRVLLVGTYRNELSKNNLKEVDQFIYRRLFGEKDYRFIDHICPVDLPSCDCAFFIPVENSIDFLTMKDAYLETSGTKLVQDKLVAMSRKLPYLDELHPIKWLKFEERLYHLRQHYRDTKLCPIMKKGEIQALAVQCGINQDKAMRFFHDTGKIVCLGKQRCNVRTNLTGLQVAVYKCSVVIVRDPLGRERVTTNVVSTPVLFMVTVLANTNLSTSKNHTYLFTIIFTVQDLQSTIVPLSTDPT